MEAYFTLGAGYAPVLYGFGEPLLGSVNGVPTITSGGGSIAFSC